MNEISLFNSFSRLSNPDSFRFIENFSDYYFGDDPSSVVCSSYSNKLSDATCLYQFCWRVFSDLALSCFLSVYLPQIWALSHCLLDTVILWHNGVPHIWTKEQSLQTTSLTPFTWSICIDATRLLSAMKACMHELLSSLSPLLLTCSLYNACTWFVNILVTWEKNRRLACVELIWIAWHMRLCRVTWWSLHCIFADGFPTCRHSRVHVKMSMRCTVAWMPCAFWVVPMLVTEY